ncbi:MAG: DNA polymerase I [Kiritimatiellia bacterium]|jgi:DNA polymerase-1
MNAPEKKLVVMDVMPLLYRGHFAFMSRPRMTSTGINTSAIHIFAMLVGEMALDNKATHLALVMDTSPTFRHERYPEYKAKREKLPEDIAASIPMAEAFAKAMNIPFLRVEGFEADDLMGTLAALGEREGATTWLVTPDKDIAQLVNDHTLLCRPPGKGQTGNQLYDAARVSEEWGVASPGQMIDLLGIAGDSSDNIPGIPGVGPKTAVQLLSRYGSLDNILAHASELGGKLAERVAEHADKARLSRWLAEIRRDAPLDVTFDDLRRREPDAEALTAFCVQYELRTVLDKLLLGAAATVAPSAPAPSPDAAQPASRPAQPKADAAAETDASAAAAPEGGEIVSNWATVETVPHRYELCDTEAKIAKLAEKLSAAKAFAFDTETTGLDPRDADLVGIAFAIVPHEAWYVPVAPPTARTQASEADELPLFAAVAAKESAPPKGEQLCFDFGAAPDASSTPGASDEKEAKKPALPSLATVVELLSGVFGNASIAKIGHNLKYDLHVLRKAGIEVAGRLSDSMLAHYVYDPASRHGLDPLAREFLRYNPIPITNLIGERGKRQVTMDEVDVARAAEYAAEDADVTLQLHETLLPLVRAAGAEPALERCENPLIRVLLDMESEGIRLDPSTLMEASDELNDEIATLEHDIHTMAGGEFNIASSQQLAKVLFEDLKLPAGGKTSLGRLSTSEEVLQDIVSTHPIVSKVLDYRAAAKLRSTYVDKLPRCIDPRTGRIHTRFNQALTETGRLSSDNPNLQNIPIRTERGRRIREAFVARDDDHRLVAADYSQIELRMMASLSGDEGMIAAFQANQDIHADTASRVYGVPAAEVTKEMRAHCKMVNFGIIYGISAFGLAQRLGTTRTKADELIKTYFDLYPGVKRYMDETIAGAAEKGYVTTLLGRRRPLRDIQSRNATVRAAAERAAINTPVQGSAADLIKLAMVEVHGELQRRRLKTRLVLQVHDELVFDAPTDEIDVVVDMIRRSMTGVMTLAVPLQVDIGVGRNWLEAH